MMCEFYKTLRNKPVDCIPVKFSLNYFNIRPDNKKIIFIYLLKYYISTKNYLKEGKVTHKFKWKYSIIYKKKWKCR